MLRTLKARYPEVPPSTKILVTASPNSNETEQLLRSLKPEIVVARCKSILAERTFRQACTGVFVQHPGIYPEYRIRSRMLLGTGNARYGQGGNDAVKD